MTTSGYRVRRHDSPATFWDAARHFLLESEAEYNLIIGLTLGMIERGESAADSLFATIEHDGRVVGCAFRTPPEKVVLTRVPLAAMDALEQHVADVYRELPAVLAGEAEGAAFAQRWSARHGVAVRAGMRQGIYQLTQVIPPPHPAPGRLRRATSADVAIVAEWLAGFARDADHPISHPQFLAAERIQRGVFWLWEDAGTPVCLAGRGGRTPGGDRIAYVFTPPEQRGRGYASTCVARLSQAVLDEGLRFCALYTDLANPTSNDIYRKLGYRLIAETMNHEFVSRG